MIQTSLVLIIALLLQPTTASQLPNASPATKTAIRSGTDEQAADKVNVVVSKIPARIVRLTAHLKVTNSSKTDVSRYVFRLTVPPNLESQESLLLSSENPPAARKQHKNGANEYLEFHFPVAAGEEVVKDVSFLVLVKPVDYLRVKQIDGRAETEADALARYLAPSKNIESDSAEVKKAAASVFRNKGTELTKARAAYKYPSKVLKFKLQKKTLGAQSALQNKIGDCTEYACLFAALCRTQSLPARRVGVFNFAKNQKKSWSQPNHHIAEVHLASHGWIPVDANLGRGKSDRPIGFGKLSNTIVILNREGAWTWSTWLPPSGYEKTQPKPKVKYGISWDGEVLKEGPADKLQAEFDEAKTKTRETAAN